MAIAGRSLPRWGKRARWPVQVCRAALDAVLALHDLRLSAAGMRLRSSVTVSGLAGQDRYIVSTFGLAVDNDVDMFNELSEVALRVLTLSGGRYEHRALVVPDSVPQNLAAVFERAFRVDG